MQLNTTNYPTKLSRRETTRVILIVTIFSVVLIAHSLTLPLSLSPNLLPIVLRTALPLIVGGIYFDLQGNRALMYRLPIPVFFLGLILFVFGVNFFYPIILTPMGFRDIVSIYSWKWVAGSFLDDGILFITMSFFQLATTYIVLTIYTFGKLAIKKLR